MSIFKQYLNDYLLACEFELRPVTVAWYGRMLRPLCDWLDRAGVVVPTVGDLRRARVDLLREDYSQTTKRDYVRMWRQFFRWLMVEGFLAEDPSARIRLPAKPSTQPHYLVDREVNQLLGWALAHGSPRDYALLTFLISTGARRRGLVGLDVGQVDFFGGRAYVVEKGEKTRAVYLAPVALNALRVYLDTRGKLGDDAPVFVSARGARMHPDSVSHIVSKLGKRAGLQMKLGPHLLRHTFARLYLLNGGDLATLSQMLGHADVSITVEYYGRFADEELRRKHAAHNPLASMSVPVSVTELTELTSVDF